MSGAAPWELLRQLFVVASGPLVLAIPEDCGSPLWARRRMHVFAMIDEGGNFEMIEGILFFDKEERWLRMVESK